MFDLCLICVMPNQQLPYSKLINPIFEIEK